LFFKENDVLRLSKRERIIPQIEDSPQFPVWKNGKESFVINSK